MIAVMTAENLLAWMAQTSVLVAAAALLGYVIRVRAARWHLPYLHVLFVACALLPAIQPWAHSSPEAVFGRAVRHHRPVAPDAAPESRPVDWSSAIPYAIAAGFAGRVIWLCIGMARLRRYRRSAKPFEALPPALSAAFELTKTRAQFAISNEIAGPVTFGSLSPVVLVTPLFGQLSEAQQLAIACHELTHVRRRDWLISLVEELTAAALWFHPGIWWLLRQIRLAREQAVDRQVIALTGSSRDYIEALLKTAETRWQLDLSPAPLFLRRRHLMDRIQQLMKEATMSRTRIYASYASTIIVLAVTAWFATSGFPLTAAPQEESGQKFKPDAILERIDVSLPEPARSSLRARLAIYANRPFSNELMNQVRDEAFGFDRTLTIGWRITTAGNGWLVLYHATQDAGEQQPEFQSDGEKQIRLNGAIMQAKIIAKPRADYPALAKASRTQGKVTLAVLVAKDGRVKDLYTMSGPPLLQESAEAAVSKWVYQTTLLNGNPVEVITTVDVNYTLIE
jgi:beta-lactamase regulating signal transducer with metallopeptidase domain